MSSDTNKLFKIIYYGEPFNSINAGVRLSNFDLIGDTDFAPVLIYAVDIVINEKILLFDGCKHGYEAMLCETYTQNQIINRPTINIYQDPDKNDILQLLIKVCHDIDYVEEFGEEIKNKGGVEAIDGK